MLRKSQVMIVTLVCISLRKVIFKNSFSLPKCKLIFFPEKFIVKSQDTELYWTMLGTKVVLEL